MAYDGTLKFDTSIDSSGFQSGIDKIGSIAGKGLKATAAIISGAGTAILGMGTAATKVGMDFEAGMSNVAAISGATGKDLNDLTAKAKEMGAKTKFSATESAEAFSYMAMAGWKTGDMLDGIEGIMNLAAASGEDLASVSDIVTDALTAFGMTASDSGHFADVLAAASSNANTNVGLMGETFKYVAPVAGALGFSAEDTATAIGLMANAGIKGSQAGTALRSVMSRMAKPTDEVSSAMEELGVSLTHSDGSMKSLSEIMNDLRNGFDGLSESEQAQMAAALGGQEAMSGLLAIVNASEEDYEKLAKAIKNSSYDIESITDALSESGIEWEKYSDTAWMAADGVAGLTDEIVYNLTEVGTSAEELQDYLHYEYDLSTEDAQAAIANVQASLESAEGAAKKMADTMNDNLSGQITILKSGLEGLGISIYENIQGPMKEIVGEAQDMVVQLQNAFNEGGLEGMIGAVGDVLNQIVQQAAEAAPKLIDAATSLIHSFCDGLMSQNGLQEAGTQLITSLLTAIADCASDILTTAIVLVGKFAGGIAEAAPQVIEAAADCITDITECISEWMPDIVDAGVNIVVSLIQGLISAAPQLLTGALQLFQALTEAVPIIADNLIRALPDIITGIVNFLLSSIPQIIESAVQMLSGFVEAIPFVVQAITDSLPQIITAITEGLIQAAPQILVSAFTLLLAITQAIPQVVLELGKAMPQITISIVEGLIGGLGAIVEAAAELGSAIIGEVSAWGSQTLQTATGIAYNVVNSVVNFFSQLPGRIMQYLTIALTNLVTWGTNALTSAQTTASDILTEVTEFFSQLPGNILEHLTAALENLRNWGAETIDSARNTASDVLTGIMDYFCQMPDRISNELSNIASRVASFGYDIVSSFRDIGSNVINGLIGGIESMVGSLYGSIQNALSGLVSKAKSALGINSPSKVFADEIGEWIPPGIGKGFERSMPDLVKDTEVEMADMVKKMQAAVTLETGKITVEKNATQSYKIERENGESFDESKTEVNISGEIHTHVELDGEEVGRSQTPIVDKNLDRIDTHRKRGG